MKSYASMYTMPVGQVWRINPFCLYILQNEDDHEDEDDLILDQIEAEEVTCTFVCILPILFSTFYNFCIYYFDIVLRTRPFLSFW